MYEPCQWLGQTVNSNDAYEPFIISFKSKPAICLIQGSTEGYNLNNHSKETWNHGWDASGIYFYTDTATGINELFIIGY